MIINFTKKEELLALANETRNKANKEPTGSYNAAWLHGYADALKAVAEGFDPSAIYREYDRQFLLEDAARHLAMFFCIDPDDPDDDPGAIQLCENTLGFDWDEACNAGGEHYILPQLVQLFEKQRDCNSAENAVWEEAIRTFIKEQSSSK